MSQSREIRAVPVEIRVERRDDGTPVIRGYAAVFDKPSVDMGFVEYIQRGAFTDVLKSGPDVRALVDHSMSKILGRTKSGTLRLAEDDVGLGMEIDVPETTVGRDIVTSIERGDVDGASFSFTVETDQWTESEGQTPRRDIVKIRGLYDVGPVTFPAYPDTKVALRSLNHWREQHGPQGRPSTLMELRQRHAAAQL